MKKIKLIFFMVLVATIVYAQKTEKETVEKDGVETKLTISDTEMYDGTDSAEAQEYFDKAEEYGKVKDFENAKKYYLKAIKKDPSFVEAYDNLGLVYRRLEDFNKAIEYYKKSIELYPEGEMAHQNLAVVYTLQEDYSNAIKEYERMVEIDAENPEGYYGLANTNMMLSQFDVALVNAEKALELYEKENSPHLSDGYQMIGLIYYYQKQDAKAKEYFQAAKDLGAQVHPQIEKDLFSDEAEVTESDAEIDYELYEEDVLKAVDWLIETPLGEEPEARKEISGFLVQWISGTPKVTIEISAGVVTYMDCPECLVIFMGGWTKYALESGDYENKIKGNLAGTESVIAFYKKNKNVLGKNKAIEKLIKLQKNNKLEAYIEDELNP